MDKLDEQIAKLKMQERLKKEENLEQSAEEENDIKEEIDLEKLAKEIESGSAVVNGISFNFKKQEYLNGAIKLPIPLNYFEENANTDMNVALVNDLHGISFTAAFLKSGAKRTKFSDFKIGLKENMKKMGFSLKWIEEGEFGEKSSVISYGTYETPTARGMIYNLIFFREHKGELVIGTYNCFSRDIKTWEPIMKSSLMLTEIK